MATNNAVNAKNENTFVKEFIAIKKLLIHDGKSNTPAILFFLIPIFITFGSVIIGEVILKEPMPTELFTIIVHLAYLMVFAIIGFAVIFTSFCVHFSLGIQFSMPRKTMIFRLLCTYFMQLASLTLITIALMQLTMMFANAFKTEPISIYLPLWAIVAMLTLPLTLSFAAGAVLIRFGKKGGWILYGIFMLFVIGPQIIPTSSTNHINAFEQLIDESVLHWPQIEMYLPLGIIGACAIILAITWFLLRKTPAQV